MSQQNQRDVERLESIKLTILEFKHGCYQRIEQSNKNLEAAKQYVKNRGLFANWAQPDNDGITSAELHIKLANKAIKFCDFLNEQIQKMTNSAAAEAKAAADAKAAAEANAAAAVPTDLFVDIYDLLQNKLSELESERSISKERTFWIQQTKLLVETLLKYIPPRVSEVRSKEMSDMQEELILACENYIRTYDAEIKKIRDHMIGRLSFYEEWAIRSKIECIQLLYDLKKSLSKIEDDDDVPLILAHYNEKVEQDTSHEKPILAFIRENDDATTKRKVAKYSLECKRRIMASIYNVFKQNGGITDAANAANAVNTFIKKTLLRFRDMHEKLKREREAQDENESALAAVNMKLIGINEILDFIESFRKELDYRVSNDLQRQVGNNKPQDYATINRALKTVDAFLKQMSTLLSQSSEETEDAKLNPIKNIVVFLNEVKKIIVEQKHAILKWFETHQSDETDTSPEDLRKFVQDDVQNVHGTKIEDFLPTGQKATNMREVDGGRKKRGRTVRKRSGKKRTNKKRKSITRRK